MALVKKLLSVKPVLRYYNNQQPGNRMTCTSHPRQMRRGKPGEGSTACLSPLIFAFVLVLSPTASAQSLLHNADSLSEINLLPGDAAVLEMEEVKKDLPCVVTPVKPVMGFDLRFHAGYEISIPLKELASSGQTLTVVFSVIPTAAKDSARYFSQKFTVPELPEDAGGKTMLEGGFDVGEGNYHVRWLMRDHMERVCSLNWDVSAALNGRDQEMKMTITANGVEAAEPEFFKPEPPVIRNPGGEPLKVKSWSIMPHRRALRQRWLRWIRARLFPFFARSPGSLAS